jgi:outer membrane protein OmpA-like peptidoglycan-associated protein
MSQANDNPPKRMMDQVDPQKGTAEAVDAAPGEKGGGLATMVGVGGGVALLLVMTLFVRVSVASAGERLGKPEAKKPVVAVADNSEEPYCTPAFKEVLQRVLNSCGLLGGEARRGCQPADVKTFASITDTDFVALFTPLKQRGAVLLFDDNQESLDPGAVKTLEDRWGDRKGARYFFVIARASQKGSPEVNRTLSHKRANSVLFHLQEQFKDPELERKVGLLWLGEEFAQLPKEYCSWPNSRADKACSEEAINRSAFVSWVDCRL